MTTSRPSGRGAAAGRQDRARGRLGPAGRRRAPEPQRLARHRRSPATARRPSAGARSAARRPCSCCRTARLLLAGFSGPEGGNIQAARLNANGALDTTFGTGGKAPVDFGGDDFGLAMARQANGRILVAGRSSAAGAVVARLRASGALDPDFDGDGRGRCRAAAARAPCWCSRTGKIVVAGNAGRKRGDDGHAPACRTARSTRRSTATARRPSTSGRSPTSPATRCCSRTARSSSPATRRPTRTSRSRASTPNGSPDATFGAAGQGDRRLRRRHVRQRGRAPAERADRRRRPEDGRRRLRGSAPAGLSQAVRLVEAVGSLRPLRLRTPRMARSASEPSAARTRTRRTRRMVESVRSTLVSARVRAPASPSPKLVEPLGLGPADVTRGGAAQRDRRPRDAG